MAVYIYIVDPQLKPTAQITGSGFRQRHPAHIDVQKLLDGGAILHHAGKADHLGLPIHRNIGLLDGIVHPVVDIKGGDILVPDAAAADIGFIR